MSTREIVSACFSGSNPGSLKDLCLDLKIPLWTVLRNYFKSGTWTTTESRRYIYTMGTWRENGRPVSYNMGCALSAIYWNLKNEMDLTPFQRKLDTFDRYSLHPDGSEKELLDILRQLVRFSDSKIPQRAMTDVMSHVNDKMATSVARTTEEWLRANEFLHMSVAEKLGVQIVFHYPHVKQEVEDILGKKI